jgi:hypothetical protein
MVDFTSPRLRGEVRVRGTLRESECVESPRRAKPSLRSGFDLSPQAGRVDLAEFS